MIMCPECGVVLPYPVHPAKANIVRKPWLVMCDITTYFCPVCRSEVYSAAYSGVEAPVRWVERVEIPTEGTDYHIVRQRSRQNRRVGLSGALPVTVVWFYHPIRGDVQWDRKVASLVVDYAKTASADEELLLIVPTFIVVESFPVLANLFHEVWQMKPELTPKDAGPYPDYKLEWKLARATQHLSVKHRVHFWPTLTMPPVDYRSPGTDEEMVRAWADYTRRHAGLTIRGERG